MRSKCHSSVKALIGSRASRLKEAVRRIGLLLGGSSRVRTVLLYRFLCREVCCVPVGGSRGPKMRDMHRTSMYRQIVEPVFLRDALAVRLSFPSRPICRCFSTSKLRRDVLDFARSLRFRRFVHIHPLLIWSSNHWQLIDSLASHPFQRACTISSMTSFAEICVCGRSFSHIFAWSNHRRTCQQSKKRLSGALDKAKEVWKSRKKSCTDASLVSPPVLLENSDHGPPDIPTPEVCSTHPVYLAVFSPQ